jgi:hypothetical protein
MKMGTIFMGADFQVEIMFNIVTGTGKLVPYQHQVITETDTLKAVNVV